MPVVEANDLRRTYGTHTVLRLATLRFFEVEARRGAALEVA